MNSDVKNENLDIALKVAQFVKMCLLSNQAFMRENGTSTISTFEALNELENVKNDINDWDYLKEYNAGYRRLRDKCSGSISFTENEIDEITDTIARAITVCGLPRNISYFDVLAFAITELDRLANYKSQCLKDSAKDDAEYLRAMKWKECLQLDQGPLYYKPFSAMIYCGYPGRALVIVTDEAGIVYEVDSDLVVKVDNINKAFDNLLPEGQFLGEKMEQAIDIAANWWTKVLTDPMFAIRYDVSASFISSVLALCYNMYGERISDEAIEVFKESLKDQIREGLDSAGHYTIKVSCDIDPSLRLAMDKANMGDIDYSLKTVMNISPEEVILTVGNGGENRQVLYSSKEKDAQKSLCKK